MSYIDIKAKRIKLTAIMVCTVIITCIISYTLKYEMPAFADTTVEDLEKQKSENEAEIAELEKTLEGLENDKSDQEEYQNQLNDKIKLQNDNITILMQQRDDLNNKITDMQDDITNLQTEIDGQEVEIADGLVQFKARIKAMYISGNDSLASVLVGSTDFYDMLAKVELISRVAKHDDELIDTLVDELNTYNKNIDDLKEQKAVLETEMATLDTKKAEVQTAIDKLQDDYEKTQAAIDDLENKQQQAEDEKSEKLSENDVIEQQQQEIQDAIDKAAEAERLKQEAANQQQANQNSGDNSSSGSSYTGGALGWPVPGYYTISSYFGPRWGTFHYGIDIAGGGISGASIVAAESGTVIKVVDTYTDNYGKDYSSAGYGNYVMLDHGGSIITLYGHCVSVAVSEGDYVEKGQTIAYVGSTGYSTGFHCHFEVRANGERVDPMGYLN